MRTLLSANNPTTPESPRKALTYPGDSPIYRQGEGGGAWRLVRGTVRLDSVAPRGDKTFASLAIAGDILGCETLLFGAYTFAATALTDCELLPWPEGCHVPSNELLLASLAQTQRRTAELVALRGGQAVNRVLGLIRLVAEGDGRVILPMRQEIAEITDLRCETISRIIKTLEREQMIKPIRIDGVHATRSFALYPSS